MDYKIAGEFLHVSNVVKIYRNSRDGIQADTIFAYIGILPLYIIDMDTEIGTQMAKNPMLKAVKALSQSG